MTFWSAMSGTAFSHRWVDVGGVSTRLVEAGEGDDALVFLHGIGGHLETFNYNIAAHAPHYRVIAFDLIGHGYTGKPSGLYEIERYVDHTMRLLDVLGIDRVRLAGSSIGGWISARIAARYPDRIKTLSLISSAGLTAHPTVMHNLKTLTERAALTPGREGVRLRLDFVLKNPESLTEELIDVRHAIYSAPDYQRAVRDVMCLQDMTLRQRNLLTLDELAKIEAPTLVLWTHDDPTGTLDDGLKYADAIRDSRFVVFDNSSHMPQLEEPERFNELHLRFLANPLGIPNRIDAQAAE